MKILSYWITFWSWVHWAALLLVFATGTWWWRAYWLPVDGFPKWMQIDKLYFVQFGFTIFVILALAAWLFTGLRGILRLTETGNFFWAVLLLQLALWARFSYGAEVRNSEVALSSATQLIFVALFALSVLCNAPPARYMAAALVAGMLLQVGVGVAQTSLQGNLGIATFQQESGLHIHLKEITLDPEKSGVSVVRADGVRYLRPYGVTAHPNLLAAMIVMGLCAGLGMWLKPNWRQWAALVGGLGGWGLLLSFSRAAVGGFIIGFGVFGGLWWINSRRGEEGAVKKRMNPLPTLLAMLVLALMVGGLFLAIYAPLYGVRFGVEADAANSATFEDYSAASRAVYRQQALDMIPNHVWRGVGIGNFAWESAYLLQYDWRDLKGDHVHNIYLLSLAEVGLVGFTLFMGALLLAFGLIIRRAWRAELSLAQLGLTAGVVAWLGIGWFDHYTWTQFGYQLLFWGSLASVLSSGTVGKNTQKPS